MPSGKTIFKMISYNECRIPLTPWLRGDEDLPSRGRVGLLVEDNKFYNKRARAEIAMRMLGWEFEEGELECIATYSQAKHHLRKKMRKAKEGDDGSSSDSSHVKLGSTGIPWNPVGSHGIRCEPL